LDGIYSKCANPIFPLFPFIKTFYATSDIITGGIPNCLFNMNNLQTLQLSGNSITGTLDKDIVLNNNLTKGFSKTYFNYLIYQDYIKDYLYIIN
jgi:hypothetical protein